MKRKLKPINDAIQYKIESLIEEADFEDGFTIDVVNEEVEGIKEGIGLVVGELNGTINIKNYHEWGGDYWEPAHCEYDVYVDCEFTYQDEHENEYSETIKYNF